MTQPTKSCSRHLGNQHLNEAGFRAEIDLSFGDVGILTSHGGTRKSRLPPWDNRNGRSTMQKRAVLDLMLRRSAVPPFFAANI